MSSLMKAFWIITGVSILFNAVLFLGWSLLGWPVPDTMQGLAAALWLMAGAARCFWYATGGEE